jgi:putative phage-type endonuclease
MVRKCTAVVMADKREMSNGDWLKHRLMGIGGSDAATAAGVNPWKSRYELWLEKTSRIAPIIDPEAEERMAIGSEIEPFIADMFSKRHPELRVEQRDFIFQHSSTQWALCNVDRFLVDKVGGDEGILEIKNVSEFSGSKAHWDGDIPFYYKCQVQWMLWITGLEWAHVAWLHGGNKYHSVPVKRDEQLIDMLVKACEGFWLNYVVKDTAPPVDGSESCSGALKAYYCKPVPEKTCEFTNSHLEVFANLAAASEMVEEAQNVLNAAKEQETLYSNQIKAMMQDSEIGKFQGKVYATWKLERRSKFNHVVFTAQHPDLANKYKETTETRVFRPKWKEFK